MPIDAEQFETMVASAVDAVPRQFLERLKNVAIVIADEPTPAQKRKLRLGGSATLLGLYEGIPQAARGANYSGVAPDKITIFRNPILALAHTEDQLRLILKDTVWHEIAHHFGMDESRVRHAERDRRRKKSP